jgi:hypothetical protein
MSPEIGYNTSIYTQHISTLLITNVSLPDMDMFVVDLFAEFPSTISNREFAAGAAWTISFATPEAYITAQPEQLMHITALNNELV